VRVYVENASWITVCSSVAIALTGLGLNQEAEGLHQGLDLRMKT